MEDSWEMLADCCLCPRECHVNRLEGQRGFCGQTAVLKAARASLHPWEEPCLTGPAGSGAVFFTGCSLQCCFCQNHAIAAEGRGAELTVQRLALIFLSLEAQGAANLNLVTPTHYIPQIRSALLLAKKEGLSLPVVYNSSGYEKKESLALLEGLVDIYLPDLKYYSPELSLRYSRAQDYFEKAAPALAEMFRQTGPFVIDPASGLMKRGMLVRHLVLPGQVKDSKRVLHYLHDTYGEQIYVSILNQYTPMPCAADFPELGRRVTPQEYGRVVDFCLRLGMENAYIQEGESAAPDFIPDFDLRGL